MTRFLPTDTARTAPRLAACLVLLFTLIAQLGISASPLQAATARFWLSNADQGPTAPTINVLAGTVAKIKVWAQPAPGHTLNAFSLNLVTEQLGAVSFQDVVVHNPLMQNPAETYRHQLVFDSTIAVGPPENPLGLDVQPHSIDGFSGLTFFDADSELPAGGGIGPNCQDALCGLGSGTPAWHIATVQFEAGAAGTSTDLFLEIGTQGIWHAGEDPTDTSALFGDGPFLAAELHGWDVEAPGECNPGPDCRNQHHGLPDAVINVVSTIADADFDDDNDVDGADFLTWQRNFNVGCTHADGDANGNGVVDDEDFAIWRMQFGSVSPTLLATPLLVSVPEPTSLALLVVLLLVSAWRGKPWPDKRVLPKFPLPLK